MKQYTTHGKCGPLKFQLYIFTQRDARVCVCKTGSSCNTYFLVWVTVLKDTALRAS